MMNIIRISVIVPIYNVAKYLDECLQSIIEQTHKNLQIILVDDGSTDESGKICDLYAEQDKRIIVIHKENGGLVSARKAGLEIAEGEYIGFVDGDDYTAPTFYETLLNEIVRTEADFVHTGYIVKSDKAIYEEISFKDNLIINNFEKKIELIRNSISLYADNMQISPSIWSKLFCKDFIKKCYAAVPDELSQGEDDICLVHSFMHAEKVFLKAVALYYYRKREGSMTDYRSVKNIEEIWGRYRELTKIFKNYNIYEYLYKDLDAYYLKATLRMINNLNQKSIIIPMFQFSDMNMIKNKKIIIYGAGVVGQSYYTQICKYQSCEIVAWIDKNYENYTFDFCEVQNSEAISKYFYDYIIVAVKNRSMAENIKAELADKGIELNKIIWKEPVEI